MKMSNTCRSTTSRLKETVALGIADAGVCPRHVNILEDQSVEVRVRPYRGWGAADEGVEVIHHVLSAHRLDKRF